METSSTAEGREITTLTTNTGTTEVHREAVTDGNRAGITHTPEAVISLTCSMQITPTDATTAMKRVTQNPAADIMDPYNATHVGIVDISLNTVQTSGMAK